VTAFRIAVAGPPIARDVRQNGQKVRAVMHGAVAAGARLVLFPEGFLSGYPGEQVQDWDDVDWVGLRGELGQVAGLAGELGLWVVLGSAHPLTWPNRPHNSMYVISGEGQVAGRYDKRFCSHTEVTRFFTPGSGPVVFDVDGFRFGCAMCIEVSFPEVFAQYERLGVDCLLLSAYPLDSLFETKARAHASVNCYWVAVSTPAQTARLTGSMLIGPDGSELARVPQGGQFVVGQLDRDEPSFDVALTKARPWRALARQGDVYHERRVQDPRSADRTCT
jgi:predicted amidohydrolase